MAVYGASHNALLQRFGSLVADFMHLSFDAQQRVREKAADVDFRDDAASHERVYRAINRGDAAAATEAMLEVVLEGKSALIEALAQLSEDPTEPGAPTRK
jgi:DNA-binding FadR family transcriptional regulator